jgi:peptide/nickel transport system ATP-binding protein
MTGAATARVGPPPVLRVEDLCVDYFTDAGRLRACDQVSFDLGPGQRLGLVGESGSGKSTMALALMRMIKPPGKIAGRVFVGDDELTSMDDNEIRSARMRLIGMVPQAAMSALNPVIRIRAQIADVLMVHEPSMSDADVKARISEVLEAVELRPEVANLYPHELSGGMKQRVCIAIAVALRPKVIIADEPTSALDVIVQRQVMDTIGRLQREMNIAVILIGHDMGLMAQFVDRLSVMYAGKLAEIGPTGDLFANPTHPYTHMLISSLPTLGKKGVFRGIPGITPSLLDLPTGCYFRTRCPYAMPICSDVAPPQVAHGPDHRSSCHLSTVDGGLMGRIGAEATSSPEARMGGFS